MQNIIANQNNCVFCQIARKETKSWIIWESSKHLAFLSIYPNMKGVTVVIPKSHRDSYAFNLEDGELSELILAAKKVSKILDSKLEGVGRTALILEGFGIDHVHVKLYPLPNTAYTNSNWQPIKSNNRQYFDQYLGYISSNDSNRAKDEELDNIVKVLTDNKSQES
jgi:diadenosine tetraphosphate (Ap4A) HIT family hydrolase